MEPAPLPAAIYARISEDKEGRGLGVERQVTDCRALAKKLGWDVAGVFIDNDISAGSGRHRPQYRAMLDAVRAGEVKGILAWHTDRLHRRTVELEEFVVLAEAHDLQIQTVGTGGVDLASASGRMFARTLGNLAQYEVDHARERMRRKREDMAAKGEYRGGPRPYGYNKGGMKIRPAEAAVIREATAAVIAGRSLASIARDLNTRGETTSQGRPWTYSRLKEMLVRPRNAGLLAHGLPGRNTVRSVYVKERFPVEIVGPAKWPAIVPEDQWRALVTLLTDPARRHQNGNDTRWLGSGIYRCGICGGRLRPAPYGGTHKNPRGRKYLYRCVESAHLTVSTEVTDDYVRGVVAELVRDPRIVAAMHPAENGELVEAREERTRLVARMNSFESDYALGQITGPQLQRATASVNEALAAVDARLTKALSRSGSSAVLRAADPGEAFLKAPIDVQRAVVQTVIRVEIITAKEAGMVIGGKWSSDRVKITPITEQQRSHELPAPSRIIPERKLDA